jgi:hypothetical protein
VSVREWLYPFPDDDFSSLLEVLDNLSLDAHADTDWQACRSFIVAVADPNAALYLSLKFENHRPYDESDVALLEANEVLIAEEDRSECEITLAQECPSHAK